MAEIASEAKLRVSVEGAKGVKDLNRVFQQLGKSSGVSCRAIGSAAAGSAAGKAANNAVRGATAGALKGAADGGEK